MQPSIALTAISADGAAQKLQLFGKESLAMSAC
jgi:hypothetical protein